jgi:hypothetical protein
VVCDIVQGKGERGKAQIVPRGEAKAVNRQKK